VIILKMSAKKNERGGGAPNAPPQPVSG